MKIGFDAKRAFSNKTGLGNYSRFILTNIIKYYPEIDILSFTTKINNGLFNHFSSKNIFHFKNKILGSFWRSFLIPHLFHKHQISLYHGLSNEIPFFINTHKTKTIVTIHDLIFLRFPSLYKPVDRIIYKFKFNYACKNADKIIAISEQTQNDIIGFLGIKKEKITVIYQNCNEIFYKKQAQTTLNDIKLKYELHKPYILCVGTIEERKNQLNLIKAFEKANLSNFILILIGGGKTYKNQIQKYLADNQINNVKLLSNIPTEDLPSIYQSANMFAYISVFEGFGIPVLEAMASQIPILAATGSCLEEAGGEAAIYVDPYDIEKIAQNLTEITSNNTLKLELIEKGKQQIKKFNSQALTSQLIELYKTMLTN
jgi:glycosyltransferase involved in cell wall biosynthesis